MCTCMQDMTFLRSDLWPGRLSTDNDNNDDNDNDRQFMIVWALWH